MNQQSNLIPFRFAWRGFFAGLAGPLAVLFIAVRRDDPYPLAINFFVPLLLMVVGSGGIGALSGFIIGLLYLDGMRVGFGVRLLVTLGISSCVPLAFFILFSGDEIDESRLLWMARETVITALLLGLLPALVTTPWGISKRKEEEAQ
jgi:hypothetical protein